MAKTKSAGEKTEDVAESQKERAAKALSEHFNVKHVPSDILGTREETTGDLIAVSKFGNKVRITDDGVEVLMGPGKPADPTIYEPPELPQADTAEDLPPLEGAAHDDASSPKENIVRPEPEDGPDKVAALEKQKVPELRAIAKDLGIDVPARANKKQLVKAIADATA
jgi:hypothetical protein